MSDRMMRDRLVDTLKETHAIRNAEVEAAFRTVPRHVFLPGVDLGRVYSDVMVPVKLRSGITLSGSSVPSMMSTMLELLDLQPGHRVLEVGTGSGYNAALMAQLVGPRGRVCTVDIDKDISERAREALKGAGHTNVKVICGDGGYGHGDDGPYDRVILTVGAWDIAPPWVHQLADDGVLLMPLWLSGIEVLAAFRRRHNHLVSATFTPCSFMRLRGRYSGPEGAVNLDPGFQLNLQVENRDRVNATQTYAQLRRPSVQYGSSLCLTPGELSRLGVWLALRRPDYAMLTAVSEDALPNTPWTTREGAFRSTFGLHSREGLALLSLDVGCTSPSAGPPDALRGLGVRCYGEAPHLAQELLRQARAWDRAGRPGPARYRIRAYLRQEAEVPPPRPDEVLIEKKASQILVSCPWSRGRERDEEHD